MYYLKYILKKTDGSEIDPEADYFVLRIDKDPVAILAAEVYAQNTPDKDEPYSDEEMSEVDRLLNDTDQRGLEL